MGKKRDNKKKTKVTLSLAEFNQGAGVGGVDPDTASLPSAPKAAEDWDAEGGRPEYNSRGYKERTTSYADRNLDADADFDDRDWSRKGPLDNADASSFGAGPERDWNDMRRGPVDSDAQDAPERDWNDIRRGPVEAEHEQRDWDGMRRGPVDAHFDNSESSATRDWGVRKGPIDAAEHRVIDDDTWGTARKGPVEAEFSATSTAEPDWTVRKGPVEAGASGPPADQADWTVRKGPVEADQPPNDAPQRDWSQRKGPIDVERPTPVEADWSQRKGPIDADPPVRRQESGERDWSARRAPVDTEVKAVQKGVRDIDFGGIRRNPVRPDTQVDAMDQWRREGAGPGAVNRRSSNDSAMRERPRVIDRPASTGHDNSPKERDWGSARRSQPLRPKPRQMRPNNPRAAPQEDAAAPLAKNDDAAPEAPEEDDWTTVRNTAQRKSSGAGRRLSGRDTRGLGRRGLPPQQNRDTNGDIPSRAPGASDASPNGSTVSPAVASAGSQM